jgi:hypothetical protein
MLVRHGFEPALRGGALRRSRMGPGCVFVILSEAKNPYRLKFTGLGGAGL